MRTFPEFSRKRPGTHGQQQWEVQRFPELLLNVTKDRTWTPLNQTPPAWSKSQS